MSDPIYPAGLFYAAGSFGDWMTEAPAREAAGAGHPEPYAAAAKQMGESVWAHGGLGRAGLHALAGCGGSVAGGGKCGGGALSAVFAEIAGPRLDALGAPPLVARMLVGGASSALGGGKFANGAMTAAFGYLFNQVTHSGRSHRQLNALIAADTVGLLVDWYYQTGPSTRFYGPEHQQTVAMQDALIVGNVRGRLQDAADAGATEFQVTDAQRYNDNSIGTSIRAVWEHGFSLTRQQVGGYEVTGTLQGDTMYFSVYNEIHNESAAIGTRAERVDGGRGGILSKRRVGKAKRAHGNEE